jgi:predicted HicB family RNase H-like nuclease
VSQMEERISKLPTAHRSADKTIRPPKGERMLHIRLDPELHRALRVIVAKQDTTLQEWVVRALAAAVRENGTREPADSQETD